AGSETEAGAGGQGLREGTRRAGSQSAAGALLAAAQRRAAGAPPARASPEGQEVAMLRLVLLAFSFLPGSHGPREHVSLSQLDRPFFVGDMVHLVPQRMLAYQPRETAPPVLDDAGSRLYVGTSDGYVRCRFHGGTVWPWRAGGST